MLLVIVFSFNRAMQLDNVLRNLLKHFKYESYRIVVIYHTAGKHAQGYQKLVAQYTHNKTITFIEREKNNRFVSDILPFLIRPRNLYRYLKYGYLRENRDNFKLLVEKVIRDSGCEFVMFSTDDTIFYRDAYISSDIFTMIRADPYQVSYRFYVGGNLTDAPQQLRRVGDMLSWDYFDKAMYHHWAYPFSVDGTIYSAKALQKVIKPVLYHNPSSLEGFICKEFMLGKLFRRGFSPIESSMIGFTINRVQNIVYNKSGNISVDMLNEKYLDGYVLDFELPALVCDVHLQPKKVLISRGDETIDLLTEIKDGL